MPHEVLRVRAVSRVVKTDLKRADLKAYDAAVAAIRSQGCAAAGKRLRSDTDGDYPMCQVSLSRQWRMSLVFREDGTIVIVSIAEHKRDENPNDPLSEIFPGLSSKGRKRSDQPPCCEDPLEPPTLSTIQDEILDDLF